MSLLPRPYLVIVRVEGEILRMSYADLIRL